MYWIYFIEKHNDQAGIWTIACEAKGFRENGTGKGMVTEMRKRVTAAAVMALVLAAAQATGTFGANSPGTGLVIGGGSDGGDSDYNDTTTSSSGTSGSTSGGYTSSTSAGNDTVVIAAGQTAAAGPAGAAAEGSTTVTVETNSRGQAVVGDTALEFVQGSENAVIGLPEPVVNTINSINSGASLAAAGTGLDLTGYNALTGTHALMTKTADTNVEKTGPVEMPLYVPNLIDGLGTVQVLYYNNMTGQWVLINPNRINTAVKTLWVTVPCSGTLTVVYKR